jgi:ABC-type amino acid transport substrate-binding protein
MHGVLKYLLILLFSLSAYPKTKVKVGVYMIAPIFYPSKDHEKNFEALTKTIGNDNMIYTHQKIEGLDDLNNKHVAIIKGAKYSKAFDNSSLITKHEVVDYDQSIKFFLSKRIDGIVIPRLALEYYVKKLSLDMNAFKYFYKLNYRHNWIHTRFGLKDELKAKIKAANQKVLKDNNLESLSDI